MKKIISIFVLVALLFSFIGFADASHLTLEQQMEIAKRRQRDNKLALAREESRSFVLEREYIDKQDHFTDVNKQINIAENSLINIQSSLEETENSIVSTRNNLAIIGGNIDEKRARVTGLLGFIGEISGKRFIDFVFSATDFSELITRNSTINKLVNGVVVALQDLKEESANQFQNQIKLEEKEIRLHELEAKQIEEQKALLSLKNKLDQIIAGISYNMKTSKELSEKYIQKIDSEDASINNIAKKILEKNRSHKTDGRFIWPVNGRLSSPYGMRIHPIYGTYQMHTGIDISHSKIMGEPIHAAADGLVTRCTSNRGYGNYIIINHGADSSGNVFQTLYAHISRYGTRLNTRVKKGQVIGYIGSTGRSTGPHLHFEVRVNGNCQNPEKYLPKRNTGNKL